ncbi:MAG: hypothetical protein M0Q92_15630, partial [Methanoregula sp.]|nr:hypothetical protein [Methanoregula sp.]
SNTICPQCGKKTAAPVNKPAIPTPRKTAHLHGISGCTTTLLKGTRRPSRGNKMATPGPAY